MESLHSRKSNADLASVDVPPSFSVDEPESYNPQIRVVNKPTRTEGTSVVVAATLDEPPSISPQQQTKPTEPPKKE